MQGIIIYNEQEESDEYVWKGIPIVMTPNFKATFGCEAVLVMAIALEMIMENHPCDANYFQTFRHVSPNGKETEFWMINDIDHATALLPSDY